MKHPRLALFYLCILLLTVLQHLYSYRQGWAAGTHGRVSHHEECVGGVGEKFFDVILGCVIIHCKLVLDIIGA